MANILKSPWSWDSTDIQLYFRGASCTSKSSEIICYSTFLHYHLFVRAQVIYRNVEVKLSQFDRLFLVTSVLRIFVQIPSISLLNPQDKKCTLFGHFVSLGIVPNNSWSSTRKESVIVEFQLKLKYLTCLDSIFYLWKAIIFINLATESLYS